MGWQTENAQGPWQGATVHRASPSVMPLADIRPVSGLVSGPWPWPARLPGVPPVALRGRDSPTVAGAAPESHHAGAHRLPSFTLPSRGWQGT